MSYEYGLGDSPVVVISPILNRHEKEALLIMFGDIWRKKFDTLDGQKGRPTLSDCIDFALRRNNAKAREDLVEYVEAYLRDMARRCQGKECRDSPDLSGVDEF